MEIVEVQSENRQQVRQFIQLPFKLYRNVIQWVPPLDFEIKSIFNRKKHPFYQYGQAVFYLVLDGDRPVGRVAAIKNDHYIQFNKDKSAFFYLFECENNPSAAKMLFDKCFEWAGEKELKRMIGPRGFTVFDGLGMLVKGFEHRPAFGLPYNMAYYPALIEAVGFSIQGELVSGYLDKHMDFPARVHRASELVQKRRGLTIKRLKSRNELKEIVPYLKRLYNDAIIEGDGNVPLTDEDVQNLTNQLIWLADPNLIKIVMKDQLPVGFLMAYPDISTAIQRAKGHLLPWGWLRMLIELKTTRWININGAGMLKEYRGVGGTAILFSEMYKSVSESRYRFADIVQIGTENDNMLREMKDFGIDFYKMHRLYQIDL